MDNDEQGYTEVDVVIAGALEACESFPATEEGEHQLDAFLVKTQHEAEQGGHVAEVFTLRHDHEQDDEPCECHQYVLDGNPRFVFGQTEGSEE